MASGTKHCPKCAEVKPLSGFYPDKTRKSGRQSWCKRCRNARKDPRPNNTEVCRRYREKNREKVRDVNRRAHKKRMSTPEGRAASALRIRLWQAVKKGQCDRRSRRDFGCTLVELREHIEAQFLSGMTWDNCGRGGWTFDHIVPLSRGGTNHYTNIQPLWEAENIRKSDRLPADHVVAQRHAGEVS